MIRNRFPGADVLSQHGHWDEATRQVVLDRVHNVPDFGFFTPDERRTLEALCDRVVPQPHRANDARIAIAPWIDQRCRDEAVEGFRYDDMPPLREAWRRGLAGLDETTQALYGGLVGRFADLPAERQDEVLRSIRNGEPPGSTWETLPARRWWIATVLREITGIYYAHPSAWDEIGYGGPAYPRGYAALNHGAREPWEAKEDLGARRQDEEERLRLEREPADVAGVEGTRGRHLQALATVAADGTGPRPARRAARKQRYGEGSW